MYYVKWGRGLQPQTPQGQVSTSSLMTLVTTLVARQLHRRDSLGQTGPGKVSSFLIPYASSNRSRMRHVGMSACTVAAPNPIHVVWCRQVVSINEVNKWGFSQYRGPAARLWLQIWSHSLSSSVHKLKTFGRYGSSPSLSISSKLKISGTFVWL